MHLLRIPLKLGAGRANANARFVSGLVLPRPRRPNTAMDSAAFVQDRDAATAVLVSALGVVAVLSDSLRPYVESVPSDDPWGGRRFRRVPRAPEGHPRR